MQLLQECIHVLKTELLEFILDLGGRGLNRKITLYHMIFISTMRYRSFFFFKLVILRLDFFFHVHFS